MLHKQKKNNKNKNEKEYEENFFNFFLDAPDEFPSSTLQQSPVQGSPRKIVLRIRRAPPMTTTTTTTTSPSTTFSDEHKNQEQMTFPTTSYPAFRGPVAPQAVPMMQKSNIVVLHDQTVQPVNTPSFLAPNVLQPIVPNKYLALGEKIARKASTNVAPITAHKSVPQQQQPTMDVKSNTNASRSLGTAQEASAQLVTLLRKEHVTHPYKFQVSANMETKSVEFCIPDKIWTAAWNVRNAHNQFMNRPQQPHAMGDYKFSYAYNPRQLDTMTLAVRNQVPLEMQNVSGINT